METRQALSIVSSVLREEVGWSWPLFLAGCLHHSNKIFSNTRWAAPDAPLDEASYLKRFAVAASIYLRLRPQLGPERAYSAVGRIIVPIGCANARQQFDSLATSKTPEMIGLPRLMAVHKLIQASDLGRFCRREYVVVTESLCHYVVRHCLALEFFTQVGTPELAVHVCQVDNTFFPQAFPEFKFSRGDSWENTIACGKDHCEFILEK